MQGPALAAWVQRRQAYELATMSRHIRPEHYAQCVTQRAVSERGTLECDAPTFAPEIDRKPASATRVVVVIESDGRETKTPIVDDPRDQKLAEVGAVEGSGGR